MDAIGIVFRTPVAMIGLVLAGLYSAGYLLLLVMEALAWVILVVPIRFVLISMGGTKHGKSASERFKEECADDVGNWTYALREAVRLPREVSRWWQTGSAGRT